MHTSHTYSISIMMLCFLKLQSSFMIDLAQVSLALRNSTSRSLIVLDEVIRLSTPSWTGINPLKVRKGLVVNRYNNLSADGCFVLPVDTDGAGLFAGVVVHLLKRGNDCPKVFASTHFHELFTRGLLSPDLPISYAYMNVLLTNDVKIPNGAQGDRTEITYLYK